MNITRTPGPPRLITALGANLAWLIFSLISVSAHAQVSTRVSSIEPTETIWNTPLKIRAELLQGETIEHVYFLYRPFGVNEWTKLEMDIVGNAATTNIPAKDVLPPFIEYYLVLANRAGMLETHPLSESKDPFSTPPGKTLQIMVRTQDLTDQQIVFLSPEPTSSVSAEDLLISVSLLRADTVIDRRATQLFLDGNNITTDVLFSDDILVYSPEHVAAWLTPGSHSITVKLLDREGAVYRSASLSFTIRGAELLGRAQQPAFRYNVAVQLESRNENIADANTWYNRGNVQLTGRTGEWKFLSRVFVTSDEKPDRQPQNRYFVGAEAPWLKVGYGDAYPSFPNLILSGKRVRGLSSSLKLDFFNVDLTLGKTTRDVEGARLKVIPLDSLTSEQQRDPNAAYARIDSVTWGKFSYGTYERDLFAIRPSFGSGETWQFGLTWLKSKDDVSSIRYGIRPQENLVVGTDFFARFDNSRIEIGGQGAFSAFNSDISSGTFTDETIDSLYKDESKRNDVKKFRDKLRSLITVNENLAPLSFKKLSTIAYESHIGLNYFNNAVRFTYLYRGNNYNSFGQTFLRKDIQGFNILDRMRLVNNLFFATLGFEHLKDNTSENKATATTSSNFNMALGYSPRSNSPTVTVGYARFANSNGLSIHDSSVVEDATNRIFVQSTYDIKAGATHTLSLNVSTSDRDDQSVRQLDVQNTTVSFGVSSQYAIPLRTSVDLAVNLNKFPGSSGSQQELNYTSVAVNGRYSILKETVIFMGTVTPTFGDFKRTVADFGTQWYALPTMSFLMQFTYLNNPGFSNDTIWSLRYQYDL
jgi:hypothetical protein